MSISTSFLVEIDKELATLRGVREKLDERIQALEAIKKPLDLGQVGLPFAAEASNGTPKPTGSGQSFQFGATFRATVLEALKRIEPARSPAVAKWLEARGFENDSTTRLSTRVYNSLWRMSQEGTVLAEDGVFRLSKADGQ